MLAYSETTSLVCLEFRAVVVVVVVVPDRVKCFSRLNFVIFSQSAATSFFGIGLLILAIAHVR